MPAARGQMAIKSQRLDADWQALVRKAAQRQGLGVGDFIVESCRMEALRVLKGEAEGSPAARPPATLESVGDALAELMTRRMGELEDRVAGRLDKLEASIPAGIPQAESIPAGIPAPAPADEARLLRLERMTRRALRRGR